MIFCTRKIEFDAGHRVIGHSNKCKFLHGHRYVLEVTVGSEGNLDKLGMVADFGVIKTLVKGWIDNNFDHNIILSTQDKELGEYIKSITNQNIYYLDSNPTAENIAMHLKEHIIPNLLLEYDFYLSKLRLYETPNCYVEV